VRWLAVKRMAVVVVGLVCVLASRVCPGRPLIRVCPGRPLMMIRNIDAMELLLIAAPLDEQVTRLANEALSEGAAVAVGAWLGGGNELAKRLGAEQAPERVRLFGREVSFTQARLQLSVRPEGFGGSDGFGSKPRESDRPPLPARSVVLTDERHACVEAMESGMRSVGVVQPSWTNDVVSAMDKVADVLLDELHTTSASDLSTPGAFWLNPPLARTADGFYLPDPDDNEAPCRQGSAESVMRPARADPAIAGSEPQPAGRTAEAGESDGDDDDDSFYVVDEIDELRF
jgi:hypothetical protein